MTSLLTLVFWFLHLDRDCNQTPQVLEIRILPLTIKGSGSKGWSNNCTSVPRALLGVAMFCGSNQPPLATVWLGLLKWAWTDFSLSVMTGWRGPG